MKTCDGTKETDVPTFYKYNNKIVFYTYDDEWDDDEVMNAA